MAKKEKIVYWSIWPILSKQARYNVIFGERSNGKTYGTFQKICFCFAVLYECSEGGDLL